MSTPQPATQPAVDTSLPLALNGPSGLPTVAIAPASSNAGRELSKRRQFLRLRAKGLDKKAPGRHPDGNGLYLQITYTGSASWILRTVVDKKRKEIGLGGYPLVTLAEARVKAEELRKVARAGGDPIAARDKQKKRAPTFREAVEIVHQLNQASWKNPKHAHQWITTLQQYVVPTLGDMTVDVIRSADIIRAIAGIWMTKPETARKAGSPYRAGRTPNWVKVKTSHGRHIDDERRSGTSKKAHLGFTRAIKAVTPNWPAR